MFEKPFNDMLRLKTSKVYSSKLYIFTYLLPKTENNNPSAASTKKIHILCFEIFLEYSVHLSYDTNWIICLIATYEINKIG